MRKILMIVVFAAAANTGYAQVYIQTTVPTVGLVQKNQLWNLVLINGTPASIEGKLDLVLRDRQTGMELLTATTNRITLTKGSSSVNVNSLNPVQYNYLAMDAAGMLNGLLPAGAYNACYAFTTVAGEKQEQLAEECISFDVEPLSPPMLIFPSDSSVQETAPTQFTWMPPTPAGIVNHLRYEVLITEIRPGQKPDEAMQDNMSFYNTADVINNFLTYPATLPAFEKEKWYAWQVIAKGDKSYAGKSEVWVFKVNAKGVPVRKADYYARLQKGEDAAFTTCYGVLRYEYMNEVNSEKIQLTIYDITGPQREEVKVPGGNPAARFGQNLFELDLTAYRQFRDKHIYLLELTNANNEKWYLKFEYRESR